MFLGVDRRVAIGKYRTVTYIDLSIDQDSESGGAALWGEELDFE